MKRMNGGVWISPWAIWLVLTTIAAALTTVFVAQWPDLKRYIKFETM